MSLHQFRLLEITDRQSSVLKAMLANEEKGMKDPMSREVIKFAKLNQVKNLHRVILKLLSNTFKAISSKSFWNC